MGRAVLILDSASKRRTAIDWIRKAPTGTRVEFKRAKRTLPQNDKMWAMLTELAEQLRWHGKALSTEDWKLIMLDALRRESSTQLRIVPNSDGTGFVNLSTSSSDLSKDEMSELIELLFAFGAKHGVVFSDPNSSVVDGYGGELCSSGIAAGSLSGAAA